MTQPTGARIWNQKNLVPDRYDTVDTQSRSRSRRQVAARKSKLCVISFNIVNSLFTYSRLVRNKMARFTKEDRKHFPLRSTDAVVALFREHLADRKEPNLTLLSVVLGALENSLTSNRGQTSRDRSGSQKVESDLLAAEAVEPASSVSSISKLNKRCSTGLPALQLSVVEALYEHFVTIVKGSVDLSSHTEKYSCASLVKKVSDVIWGALTRTFYKDRAHLQTVFTLLTGMSISASVV